MAMRRKRWCRAPTTQPERLSEPDFVSSREQIGVPAVCIRRAYRRMNESFEISLSDIAIPVGAMVAIIGANGAGKSTLIELLLGFGGGPENDIELLGSPLAEIRKRPALRAELGAHLQRSAMLPQMYVSELVQFHGAMYGTQE